MGQKTKEEWEKTLKECCASNYHKATKLSNDPDLCVEIIKTDETGEKLWAIDAGHLSPGFWLDAKKTKKEAIQFCRDMGWKYK